MINRSLLIVSIALILGSATFARAQHSDIQVEAVKGRLAIVPGDHGHVYEGELGETIPNFGSEPGFEAEDGQLSAGDELGFNLLSSLLYWDGAGFTSPPNGEQMTISKGPLSMLVTPDSGQQDGFLFAMADDVGGLHEDLEFVLARPDSNPDTSLGAYGLWLELTSPHYERSPGFIILLNNGLDEIEFEAGVVAAGALVPEPSAAALACVAGVVLAGFGTRARLST